MISPRTGSKNIPLTVKSRRSASICGVEKVTRSVAAVDVRFVGAERGDWNSCPPWRTQITAEMRPHGDGAREEPLETFGGRRAGGDVVVLRVMPSRASRTQPPA